MTAIQQRPGTYNTATEAIATLLAITTGLLLWALRTKDRENLGSHET